MKRKCFQYKVPKSLININRSQLKRVNIDLYIDLSNHRDICSILNNPYYLKKTKAIILQIMSNKLNKHLYGSEQISKATKDITAFKYIKMEGNPRIYCKEFIVKGRRKIVLIKAILKTSNKITNQIIKLIKEISTYEYFK